MAEARRSFAELLRSAAKAPQLVYRRDEPVAAVVDAASFEEFAAWRAEREARSLGREFDELRRLCAEEGYEIEVPERQDRASAFNPEAEEAAG